MGTIFVRGRLLALFAASGAFLFGCGGGGGGGSTPPPPPAQNPVPSINSLSPGQVTTGAGFKLTVTGSSFVSGSSVLWNGTAQTTTFVNSTTLTANIPQSAVASPTEATITVSTPSPGGGTSAGLTLMALWPKPTANANGYLVDVATQAATRAQLDGFGNPLFAAWNTADVASILSPGMKIVMWGSPDPSCPSNTQGPMGTFADASLVGSGYPSSPANVPDTMRFEPVPMGSCTAASAGRQGPGLVFGDGTQIWLSTSSLGQGDALLNPWTAAGQNGHGANAHIADTVVTFETPQPWTIHPWVGAGVARIAAMARTAALTADDATKLTQVKQETEVTFVNTACLAAAIPANQCQMEWQFEESIAQSGVTDWSTVPWAQYPNLFLDPAQGTVPVMVVTLVPGAGKDVADGHTGLSLATSQGVATQHGAIPLTQFDVSISFSQLENAIRIISAKFLNQPVGADAACAQCSKVLGASWNDPSAWVAIFVQVEQEDYDPSGKSGAILGGFSWLYVGAAPP
jgi:IPT/TIG domain